jgi:hypothetical protein
MTPFQTNTQSNGVVSMQDLFLLVAAPLLTAKSQDILNGHGSQKVKGRHMMNEAPL